MSALARKTPAASQGFAPRAAIGLMSGTSMDGVDAAYVKTDGVGAIERGAAITVPYSADFRARLKAFIAGGPERDGSPAEQRLEAELTDLHVAAVRKLMAEMKVDRSAIDIVGFHGQTIWHKPGQRLTWQMGDGAALARALDIPVAFDFRSADVHAGGQGAPLLPIFHAALAPPSDGPIAVVNVGGVANVTWMGARVATDSQDDAATEAVFETLLGFDTGPGNGLVDDWVAQHLGLAMDAGGTVAAKGRVHEEIITRLLAKPFFARKPPKSLDRFDFPLEPFAGLNVEDGAATLTAFTAACVAQALGHCPAKPAKIFVAGGGRHNATLMRMLGERTGVTVASVDTLGWQGDALEAQAFGYLAVRCLRGLPITFPGTTGIVAPAPGGQLAKP